MANRAYQNHTIVKNGKTYHSLCWTDDPHNRTDWYRKGTDAVVALSAGKVKFVEKLGLLSDLEYKEEFNEW